MKEHTFRAGPYTTMADAERAKRAAIQEFGPRTVVVIYQTDTGRYYLKVEF